MPDNYDVPPLPPEPPDDEQEAPSKLDRLRAALLDTDGLENIPEPTPLIRGVINRDTLVWLQGKSGDGKSFVALDMAGCIGTGTGWQTYPVAQGKVLYVVAEGASGIRWRVRAWEKAYGEKMLGVRWLPEPVQAALELDWQALVDLVRETEPILVIIDTQARVTVGMEENAAKDMGEFVDRVEKLRKASKACVLVVHHQGRNGEHMRGSTALEGAAFTIIKVVKDEDELTLTCEKQKDAEPFEEIKLRLVPIGDSATLMPSDGIAKPSVNIATMKTARKWWESFGSDKVSVSKLTKAQVAPERTLYRHVRELVDKGIAQKQELGQRTFYWLDEPPDIDTATPATPKGVVAVAAEVSTASGSQLAVVAELEDTQVNALVTAKTEVADVATATATATAENTTSAMIQKAQDDQDEMNLGPCVRCQNLTVRYGDHGNPLCEDCRGEGAS